jgi:hypothetical protein
MTSFEKLADAAFAAAVDLQQLKGGKPGGDRFRYFAKLLREPISADHSYKLLYDARNLPLYREAWRVAFPDTTALDTAKGEALLGRIADALQTAEKAIETHKSFDVTGIARFCLHLNRIFLEENGRAYSESYKARASHAST